MQQFHKFSLDFEINPYSELLEAINFEHIAKGRKASVIVIPHSTAGIPIIRTTTAYNKPAYQFSPIYHNIADRIHHIINSRFQPNNNTLFNNALVEIYDNRYTKMGYHSDQCLDLANDSYIALFSCYDDALFSRKLVTKNKTTGEEFELILDHNSVVLFSTSTNRQFLHKIVSINSSCKNKWLGITFRTSKTFINFNAPLTLRLANDIEKKEFYRLKSMENSSNDIEFAYPKLDYTISSSDIMPV